MTDTRRRVKLYALNADRQWDDRGTGHVSSSYIDKFKGTSLLVRAESDGTILLESKIQPDTAYQKQQVCNFLYTINYSIFFTFILIYIFIHNIIGTLILHKKILD